MKMKLFLLKNVCVLIITSIRKTLLLLLISKKNIIKVFLSLCDFKSQKKKGKIIKIKLILIHHIILKKKSYKSGE